MNKCQAAIASVLLIGLAGCQQAQEEGRDNDNHNPNFREVKQSVDEPNANNNQNNVSSEDIAQHLVKVAESESQVNDATALVTMGYAVVGIDVNKDLDRQGVDDVKYSVAQAMQHERYGANAVIIADPDSVQQLKEMKSEIQNGRPVTGILDQLADMVGRLMPQVPSDMVNPGNNQAPNQQNKQQLQNQNQGGPQNQPQNQPNNGPGNKNQTPNMKNKSPNNRSNMNKQQTPPKKPNQMKKPKPNKSNKPSKEKNQA